MFCESLKKTIKSVFKYCKFHVSTIFCFYGDLLLFYLDVSISEVEDTVVLLLNAPRSGLWHSITL